MTYQKIENMRTLIFIKGNQGVVKSVIAQKIGNSIEVHSLKDAKKAAKNRQPYAADVVENIIFTTNNSFEYPEISKKLKELCKKHHRLFIEMSIGAYIERIEVVDAEEIKVDQIKDPNDIDASTKEGKYLYAALAKITTESQTDKTPYEVLDQLTELKNKMNFSK